MCQQGALLHSSQSVSAAEHHHVTGDFSANFIQTIVQEQNLSFVRLLCPSQHLLCEPLPNMYACVEEYSQASPWRCWVSGESSCLGCSLTSVSQRGREDTTNTRQRHTTSLLRPQVYRWMTLMAGLAALCLLLVFPLSSSQSTLQSEQEIRPHQGPEAAPPPPPPPQIQGLLREEETTNLNAKKTHARLDKDNAKVGLFIAASAGTCALMAAVYCIYNKFYTKQQYLHTQLNDDSDLTTDPMDPPPVFFNASPGSSAADVRRAGYGSLSDTPSIISVPPCLSPPPSAMPFPPLFVSSRSLRTISAKDLERSCI